MGGLGGVRARFNAAISRQAAMKIKGKPYTERRAQGMHGNQCAVKEFP